jgi:hypothetical protein
MPKLYNKHHGDAPQGAVYIGRGSPWGNPYIIGIPSWSTPEGGYSRNEVCQHFEAKCEREPEFREAIKKELKGKDLVCYCAPARCHGETLLRIANEE